MNTAAARAGLAREVRYFNPQKLQLRASDDADNTLEIEGYACVTETPYEVNDWLGTYTEVVREGAFAKTLAERDDVRLLLNHNGLPLARTKSGTLDLAEDGTGLLTKARLDSRSGLVNDVKIAMERGDMDQMSFAFKVLRQEWNADYTERTITELKLFDVSVVTYPANPHTSVKLRADDADQLSDDEARELWGRLNVRFAAPAVDLAKLQRRRRQLALLDLK